MTIEENEGSNSNLKKKKPAPREQRDPPLSRKIANDEAPNIIEYFRNMTGGAPVKVKIFRNAPTMFKGKNIAGLIATVDELPSEEDVQALYGGGKFTIQVHTPKPNGAGFSYAGQRQIQIAGDPRLDNMPNYNGDHEGQVINMGTIGKDEDTGLVRHAISMVEKQAAHERERAARLEAEMKESAKQAGLDPAILDTIRATLQTQVDAAQRRADLLEQRLYEKQNEKPEANPVQEKLFERMLTDDSARINAVREAHMSELRAMRENHQAELHSLKNQAREDLKRSEERADRMMDMAEKTHVREVENLRHGSQAQLENLKAAFEARLAVIEGENRRLHKELEERKVELVELRNKKDKSPTDQILEFAQLKDALETLRGDEEKEPQSTAEKIFERASPLLEAIGQRVMAPAQAAQPQVNPAVMQAMMQQAAAQPGGPPNPARVLKKKKLPMAGAMPVPPSPIALEDIKTAVNLIEGAINNGQDPQAFASTISSIVPGSIINAINAMGGVDKFLADRVQLGVNSPLTTQQGRNFIRKVEKILIGDNRPDNQPDES